MPFGAKSVSNGTLTYIDFGQFKLCKFKDIEFSLKTNSDKELTPEYIYELVMNHHATIEAEYPDQPDIWSLKYNATVNFKKSKGPHARNIISRDIIKDLLLELIGIENSFKFGKALSWYKDGKLHRLDGPAFHEYNDKYVITQEYYQNGLLHRIDGPALRKWFDNGSIKYVGNYRNGHLYEKPNGIALVEYNENGQIIKKELSNGFIIFIYNNGKTRYAKLQCIVYYDHYGNKLCYFDKDDDTIEKTLTYTRTCENDNPGVVIKFYSDTMIQSVEFKNDHGQYDNKNQPAIIKYSECGNPISEKWYKDGKLHRNDGPALITYGKSSKPIYEKWYKDGQLHRTDAPALIMYGKSGKPILEEYYQNGKLLNPNGAHIKKYNFGQLIHEEYQLDRKLHRTDGPAIRKWSKSGQLILEEYYLDGVLQKSNIQTNDSTLKQHKPFISDKPSIQKRSESGQLILEEYRLDGKLHRDSGPALRKWSESGQLILEEYYQYGKYFRLDDLPVKIEYQNDILLRQIWVQRTNPNDPLGIEYYPDGSMKLSKFKTYGINYYPTQEIHHRLTYKNEKLFVYNDEPSFTEYYKSGVIKKIMYRIDTILHRLNGPAMVEYNEAGEVVREEYYENNIKLR